MTALGWVLLAVGGWILLSALTVAVWAWLGRWHNRRLFLRHAAALSAEPIGVWSFADDFDEHVAIAGVLDGDSRFMARWCDQRTIDRLFLGMVDTPAMRAIDHRIRPAAPDKEN